MTKPASSAVVDPGSPFATNLLACWPMLEGTGTTSADLSGNGHTLTFAGGGTAPTWSTNGAGEAIIALGTALTVPLAIGSPFTLPSTRSWAIAWRAKQTTSGDKGQVIGDSAASKFVWMKGGTFLRLRSNGGADNDFTSVTTFTADADYLLVFDKPNAQQHLYIDGVEVASSPIGGAANALTCNTLGNGFAGSLYALVGDFTYCYVWDMVSGLPFTATEAASLHTNPYSFVVTSPTLNKSPTTCYVNRTITLSLSGSFTSWLSENPVGLFTVSGGTGATISAATVTSDGTATVQFNPGSTPGTITITDTSTSVSTTFTTTDAFAGGWLSAGFAANSQVNGVDGTGRTYIDADKTHNIRQHGPITKVKARINAVSGSNGFKFKVFRPNGSNYDFVSESELITPGGTGVQTFVLGTPMSCQPGDVVGVFLTGAGNGISLTTHVLTPTLKYSSGDQTGTNWAPATTANDLWIDIEYRTSGVDIIATGDSRDAGHNGATDWRTHYETSGISGNLTSQPIHQLQALMDATRLSVRYQNFAMGSQMFSHLSGTQFPDIFNTYGLLPSKIFTQCGVNDIINGRTNAQVLANLDTAYALVPANTRWYLDTTQPWTAGTDAQAIAIRSLNAAIIGWAVGKSRVTVITNVHDDMGQLRGSTGQLDDMATAYDEDGVHMTVTAGVDKLADIRYAALSAIVASNAIRNLVWMA